MSLAKNSLIIVKKISKNDGKVLLVSRRTLLQRKVLLTSPAQIVRAVCLDLSVVSPDGKNTSLMAVQLGEQGVGLAGHVCASMCWV